MTSRPVPPTMSGWPVIARQTWSLAEPSPAEARARDLFYALWIPDLFMQRVEADGDWDLTWRTKAKVAKTVKARDLLGQAMSLGHDGARERVARLLAFGAQAIGEVGQVDLAATGDVGGAF